MTKIYKKLSKINVKMLRAIHEGKPEINIKIYRSLKDYVKTFIEDFSNTN